MCVVLNWGLILDYQSQASPVKTRTLRTKQIALEVASE